MSSLLDSSLQLPQDANPCHSTGTYDDDDDDTELDLLASLIESEYVSNSQAEQETPKAEDNEALTDSRESCVEEEEILKTEDVTEALEKLRKLKEEVARMEAALSSKISVTNESNVATPASDLTSKLAESSGQKRFVTSSLKSNVGNSSTSNVSQNGTSDRSVSKRSGPPNGCKSLPRSLPIDRTSTNASSRSLANLSRDKESREQKSAPALSSVNRSSEQATEKKDLKQGYPVRKLLEGDIFSLSTSSQSHPHESISKSGSKSVHVAPGARAAAHKEQDDDSGSDWEGLDGEQHGDLNSFGKDVKVGLMKLGARERVAHAPDIEKLAPIPVSNTSQSAEKKVPMDYLASIMGIPSASLSGVTTSYQATGMNQQKNKSDDEARVVNADYFRIRYINPKVSSNHLKSLMENRRSIRLSSLLNKSLSSTGDIDGDWVTMGVIVAKSEPKVSTQGKKYSIWKLSDLTDCDKMPISFFLFDDVHKEHWKTDTKSVIGLLNASFMRNTERESKGLCITLDNPNKLLLIGVSRDYGTCQGKTKTKKSCLNFINTTQGNYCSYHVLNAHKKSSAQRSELQSGFSCAGPRALMNKVMRKGESVIYGGQSFSTSGRDSSSKKKVSIESLKRYHSQTVAKGGGRAKFNTITLHDLLPEDELLLNNETTRSSANNGATGETVKTKAGSVKKEAESEVFHELLSIPTAGSMNLVKHLKNTDNARTKSDTTGSKGLPSLKSITASDMLKEHAQKTQELLKTHSAKVCESNSSSGANAAKTPLSLLPKLGRGLNGETEELVDLDDIPVTAPVKTVIDIAKLKAIRKIQAAGGIVKENPNAVKKSLKSIESQEKIRKRLHESENNKNTTGDEPEKKKSRLIGNVDLHSSDVQHLLNAKSAHAGLVTEEEEEQQAAYFNVLEKTEQLEQKLDSIYELDCNSFSCKQCNYSGALSAGAICRKEQHAIKCHKAKKRFFRCKKCKRRITTLYKYPVDACTNCGETNFERTSMLQEKKIPTPAEQLLLRGEEVKYLNSLAS